MRLLWLLVALPIVEIALFIKVGGMIGVGATLLLIVLALMVGILVIRSQGSHAWREVQRSVADLRDPSRPLAHGMMLLIAGGLLILPGFLTDGIALLLLVPPVRDLIIRRTSRRVRATRLRTATSSRRQDEHRPPYAGGVIDADYEIENEPLAREHKPSLDLHEDIPDTGPPPRDASGWTRH